MGNCACCKNEKKGRYEVSVPGGDALENGHTNNRVSRAQKTKSGITEGTADSATSLPTNSSEVKQNGSSYQGQGLFAVAAPSHDGNNANAAADGAVKTEDIYASVKGRKKSSAGTSHHKTSNGTGDESAAAVRIQTKYRQYQAKKVVKEMKKERHHQADSSFSSPAGDEDKVTESEVVSGEHVVDDSDVPVSHSHVNGKHSGKDLTDEERAAVKIQAGLRGMRDRKMVKSMKSQSRDQSNDVSASQATSD